MVYLDYNATTPVAREVLDAMEPTFERFFGNPSNTSHRSGRDAAALVESSRNGIAASFGASPGRVIFTSGATEAINLAIKGLSLLASRGRVLVGATEHKATLEAALAREDVKVEVVPVTSDGILDLERFVAMVDASVGLIAVMAVNNETGVIHPIGEVIDIARQHGALTLCDASQAVGRIGLEDLSQADFVALSGHKIYGPKGIGSLICSKDGLRALRPLLSGGGQERNIRSGTLNVPGIVGLSAAVSRVTVRNETELERQRNLRDKLQIGLERILGGVFLNGHPELRVCNTANLQFEGADADAVLTNLRCAEASTGSACHSAVPEPSHVLIAMGRTTVEADESIRFSLGTPTTDAEIDEAIEDIASSVKRVRDLQRTGGRP